LLVVDVPCIQLLGKITFGEDDLTGVELKVDPRAAAKLEQDGRFTVGAWARTFVLNTENSPAVTLTPGKPVDFTLEATTRNAQAPGRSPPVRIEYQPRLPELELTSPRADEERTQAQP